MLTSANYGLYHQSLFYSLVDKKEVIIVNAGEINEEKEFVEFRRKVRSAEVLSAAIERLLRALHFTGRVSVVVQNGRVLKSGYEEGYFRHHPATAAEGPSQ